MKKGLEGRLKLAMIDEFSYRIVQDVVTNSSVDNAFVKRRHLRLHLPSDRPNRLYHKPEPICPDLGPA